MLTADRSKVFEERQSAELELNGVAEKYPTRIEEVRSDVLVIATPMRQREYLSLDPGRKVVLSVIRRSTPYFYDTAVVGTEWQDGQQLTLLRRPADSAGTAPRRHVRVPVTINDGQFWAVEENEKFGATIPGSIVDLSAGGLQVMTKTGLPEGQVVLVRFTLSRVAGHLMVDARVLRDYERLSDVGVKTHRSHLEFLELPERERDRLIKFVFQRERELRQKGVF